MSNKGKTHDEIDTILESIRQCWIEVSKNQRVAENRKAVYALTDQLKDAFNRHEADNA